MIVWLIQLSLFNCWGFDKTETTGLHRLSEHFYARNFVSVNSNAGGSGPSAEGLVLLSVPDIGMLPLWPKALTSMTLIFVGSFHEPWHLVTII